MAVIKVKNLVKRFGDLTAVDGISFEVESGELFGFLGPNGAGKTTTIRMLTGILKSDSGSIRMVGMDPRDRITSIKEKLGIVPEIANAYVDLTGWQNMMLNGELYGLSKEERINRGEELLKTFGLYDRKDSKVKQYSKGMKQRLMFSMALINDPSVLFLDEPISGLDVQSQELIREKIKEIKNQGKTVFLTTHNILEADRICDRVAIINNGRIAVIDTPENLKNAVESSRSVLISFSSNPDGEELTNLDHVEGIEEEGDKFRLFSSDLDSLLKKLTIFADENDLDILTVKTLGPSLEEVFTKVTGDGK